MEFFLEQFFQASRAKWWQLLAATLVGAIFGLIGVHHGDQGVPNVIPCVASGAALGFVAGLFLLWVDAGQRCREMRNDSRLTFRERILAGGVILGLTLGMLSI